MLGHHLPESREIGEHQRVPAFLARQGPQADLGDLALAGEIEQRGIIFIHLIEHSIRIPSRKPIKAVAVVALADPAGLLAAPHDAAPLSKAEKAGDDRDAFSVQGG